MDTNQVEIRFGRSVAVVEWEDDSFQRRIWVADPDPDEARRIAQRIVERLANAALKAVEK